MKKTVLILCIIFGILFLLCTCAKPSIDESPDLPNDNQTTIQTIEATTQPTTATPNPTMAPTMAPTAVPTPEQTEDITTETLEFYSETPDDLVIIADDAGVILYGYAKGKWITHTEATRYFKKGMVFYQYSIDGLIRKLTAVSIEEAHPWYSESGLSFDKEAYRDYGKHYGIGFEGNPEIQSGIITNVPPDKIPQTTDVIESPEVKSRVQSYLEFTFGENVPTVNIVSATQVDIDGDGKDEIMVNANNNIYDTADEKPWYSLMFVIESDNSVHIVQEESYIGVNEYELNHGRYYLVVDIDEDGRCEIILDEFGYECYGIYVYSFNGYFNQLKLHTGSCA